MPRPIVSRLASLLPLVAAVVRHCDGAIVDAGAVTDVIVSAPIYDDNLGIDGGCDPAGCIGDLTRDGDYLSPESRWSCKPSLGPAGSSCSVTFTFGESVNLQGLNIATYQGDTRIIMLEVYVDGVLDTTWSSSGKTTQFEGIDLADSGSALTVELRGVLADTEWISISEVEILVDDGEVPFTPATTPAPVVVDTPEIDGGTPEPTTVSSPTSDGPEGAVPVDSSLLTVGLLPLATGEDTSDLDRFYVKDGDFATSWTCTGNPPDGDETISSCSIYFNLFHFRHLKQIRIALADGASRVQEMSLGASAPHGPGIEQFVASTGDTNELETYDLDYYTKSVRISGIFKTAGDTISISEVEFLEEPEADGVLVISSFNTPFDSEEQSTLAATDSFEWQSDSDDAFDRTLSFGLNSYAAVTAIDILFPAGDSYNFEIQLFYYGSDGEPGLVLSGQSDSQSADYQTWTFDTPAGAYVDLVSIRMLGTEGGSGGFKMLDARIIGTPVDDPSGEYWVESTFIDDWETSHYPEYIGEGSGDQKAIMGAICAVKKATFDGVDCVDEDPTATGTVHLSMGNYYIDGNIFMKSGVFLDGRFSDDSPYYTGIILEEGAAGNTDIAAMVVFDGIRDARTDDLWIRGHYDPESGTAGTAVPGLGSRCIEVFDSQNLTLLDTEVRYCDGDAVVVSSSSAINIDAGRYEDIYAPWSIGESRGTGLVVDASDSVWVRRHTMKDNGVAGIHLIDSHNFTFEATIGESAEGKGNVGSVDGQQPIDVIIESTSLVSFTDLRVQSSNDPVMTVSADSTDVFFTGLGLSAVEAGVCVIQMEDPSVVSVADDEVTIEGNCWVKV